jgi:adenylate cyclase
MTSSQEKTGGSRRLAAVWFADIVGFTRLSTENEPLALRLVEAVQATATAAVESHGGKIVKFMGDGVMAEFASTEGAAFGGLQLLLRFDQVTEGWEQGPHRLRLGMHLGDVAVAADGDIYGEGVNRASRLEGLAEPGTFMVSEDVFRQLRNRPDLILTELGTRSIKGYDDPLPVYDAAPTDELAERLLLAAEAPEEPADTTPSPSLAAHRRRNRCWSDDLRRPGGLDGSGGATDLRFPAARSRLLFRECAHGLVLDRGTALPLPE